VIPTHIIIHHSLTDDSRSVSWGAIRWYHMHSMGWNDIGYHLGLELVGEYYEILMGRQLDEVGAHTIGMNDCSVGICVIGNYDLERVPEAAMVKLIHVTRSLQRIFDIPTENVKRHSDYAGYKTCPGKRFQWDEFLLRL